MKNNQELFDFISELVVELRSLDKMEEAEALEGASHLSIYQGEVFGAIRLELIKLENVSIGLTSESAHKIREALSDLDKVLGPRPKKPPYKRTIDIKTLFNDWTESKKAQYYLCCLLGIMNYDESLLTFKENKLIFHSKSGFGAILCQILDKMVEAGMLEFNQDSQFRWNKSFRGEWE